MAKQKFYITTPIYYPSGKWHLGTCYTTVICDAIARFKRLDGFDVFYLTGTDEHGQKIERSAQAANMPVKKYIDKQIDSLKSLWKLLDISYDKFIRTTDKEHKELVQKVFKKLYEKGDIYKGFYKGWYCTPCEAYWTESQLEDGNCPDCHRKVEKTQEEAYFFRLSKYQDKLIELMEDKNCFLFPESRRNEMLNNFLRPGLQDLCISRTTFDWGIPVDFDKKHVVYVWLDALLNYVSALGYLTKDDKKFKKYWPADIHMMAKEIVRFHSIIWPAILMSLDLPLPKKIFAHGWLLFGSDKISKSKKSTIVADPVILIKRYGLDTVRYFLLREIPFGQDGSYTNELFFNSVNAELVNTLGNLVSRSTAMCEQYFKGVVPEKGKYGKDEKELISSCEKALDKMRKEIDKPDLPKAISVVFELAHLANKYIDKAEPWQLAKDEKQKEKLATVIYVLLETIRYIGVLIKAFLPETGEKILKKLSIKNKDKLGEFKSLKKFGQLEVDRKIEKGEALFNRLNVQKELKELENIHKSMNKDKEKMIDKSDKVAEITIDEFFKTKLVAGKILNAEKIAKSKKLLKLEIDLGEKKTRTIVSGIAQKYKPDEIIGKMVAVVANLKPTKLCGVVSEGMVLSVGDDKDFVLIMLDEKTKVGSEIS